MSKKFIYAIFIIVTAVALTEGALRLRDFVFYSMRETENINVLKERGGYRILCLGDSMTALGGISYPRLLEEILNEGNGRKFTVINKGMPRAALNDIADKLEGNIAEYKPQMIVVLARDQNVVPVNETNNLGRFLAKSYIYQFVQLSLKDVAPTQEFTTEEQNLIRDIADKAEREGVEIIFVQYPLLSISLIQEILGKRPNVYFAENKKNFEEALAEHSYNDIFVDRSGGIFGHCTLLGNRIIAQSIADVLRKALQQGRS